MRLTTRLRTKNARGENAGEDAVGAPSSSVTSPANRSVESHRADETKGGDPPLFRPEAWAFALKKGRLNGNILLATPVPLSVFGILLAVLIIGGGLIAVFGTYTSKVNVTGWVQPEAGIIRAIATRGGRVESLVASEGANVGADQPLAGMSLQADISEGKAGALILGSVADQSKAIETQTEASRRLADILRTSLVSQRANAAKSLVEARARSGIAEDLASIASQTHERAKRLLAQGAYSQSSLDQDQARVLSASTALSQARSNVLDLEGQILTIDTQLASLPEEAAQQEAQQAQMLAELAEKRTDASVQSRYLVNAPVRGRVLAVPVEIGQELKAGDTIAILAPEGSDLVADLYVPSRAIGFVTAGQPVNVMYHAFPYQRFGMAKGTVTRVSDTVLAASEVTFPGSGPQEPVFRVRVSLAKQTVRAYGREIPLQPGMLLNAQVMVRQASFGDWLFDSIRSVGAQ